MPQIPGLDHTDQNTLDKLLNQLASKMPRNRLRSMYYDSKYLLKDLGISTPPNLRNFDAVLGWPAKAVDQLARRCNLDDFVLPEANVADFGIPELWEDNYLDIESHQAHTSALIHSVVFIATTLGDVASGEPEVLVTARDAMTGTGIYSARKRALSSALSIVDVDENTADPNYMIMYLPDKVVTMTKNSGGVWKAETRNHSLGRVPVEPLVYQPRLGRPFGASRISRAVMSHTDSALRTVVRSEIGAEFFTAPQRYALNVPQEAFGTGGWAAVVGRILALDPPDEDEGADPNFKPEVGQFPQISMQPHSEQLRMWATLFAGETSIPLGSLGVVQDNPSSADAMDAAKADIVLEAEFADNVFGVGWARAMRTAVQLRDGLDEVPAELRRLRAKWRDPNTPSKSQAADAMSKQIAAMPWIGETEVALESLGYDRTTIERLLAEKRRNKVSGLLDRLPAAADAARTNVDVAELAARSTPPNADDAA
ncbi:hypothetical protein CH298_02700 [Rhodococcoides fascians]|uniref:phage portal protein n=1 Tax=Rhodococcoides fascians TaxID=1828 RepID=UPI000B9C61F3|nr:phage portal protein [Rhodococcus fascians]OZE92462.1 hypothetical protein CH303_02700 [Rhodococcus fascians]OZF23095.1 hypothetical protein CH298_02700 [Rhodococcus fascians]OZF24809.1 hypothetical protein CH297_02700 [Rhodococcus fascians]OZF72404.1 hypothetical protein CH308_02705 [Rhodococcus fascians]OZF73702.1 hypothetical protein CH307_02700 [Rhodococcus fascians]